MKYITKVGYLGKAHARLLAISSPLSLLPLLNRLKQRRGGFLTIPLRIITNPPPQILAGVLERELGLPAQLLVGAGRVGSQVEHVAGSAFDDFVFERAADDLAEGVDHLEHGAAAARA